MWMDPTLEPDRAKCGYMIHQNKEDQELKTPIKTPKVNSKRRNSNTKTLIPSPIIGIEHYSEFQTIQQFTNLLLHVDHATRPHATVTVPHITAMSSS